MTHQLLPYKYQTVFIMKKVATMKVSEKQIRNIVRESIRRSLKSRLNEWRWDDPAEHDRQKAFWARFGYEMVDREDDEPIFVDNDGNEFVLDDYGHRLVPIENNFDDEGCLEENEELPQWRNGYTEYVVIDDSDGAILGNYSDSQGYNAKQEAINDAISFAKMNRLGSYSVFGCANGMYDDNSLVFSTTSDADINVTRECVESAKRLNERGDLPDDYEEDENGLPKDLNQQIDKANAFYAKDLEEDTKYTEFTNYNVDASETLGYVNQAFDTLDRMMKRMYERSDIFGENLGNMAFETARKLRSMKQALNAEFTNSQSPKVNRNLRPRK